MKDKRHTETKLSHIPGEILLVPVSDVLTGYLKPV